MFLRRGKLRRGDSVLQVLEWKSVPDSRIVDSILLGSWHMMGRLLYRQISSCAFSNAHSPFSFLLFLPASFFQFQVPLGYWFSLWALYYDFTARRLRPLIRRTCPTNRPKRENSMILLKSLPKNHFRTFSEWKNSISQ